MQRRYRTFQRVQVPSVEIDQLDTVVISGGEKGDRLVESPEVKVSVREASNLAGRSESEQTAPKSLIFVNAEPLPPGRRSASSMKELITCSRRGYRGLRRRHAKKEWFEKARIHSRVAKAFLHSEGVTYKPITAKSRRACEWGGWGRISVDEPGQHNPDRSEGPWGHWSEVVVIHRASGPALTGATEYSHDDHEGRTQTNCAMGMPGTGLTEAQKGRPRLKRPPLSRTGENPPYGMCGGLMETSASFEARSAPSAHPTISLSGSGEGPGRQRPGLLYKSLEVQGCEQARGR